MTKDRHKTTKESGELNENNDEVIAGLQTRLANLKSQLSRLQQDHKRAFSSSLMNIFHLRRPTHLSSKIRNCEYEISMITDQLKDYGCYYNLRKNRLMDTILEESNNEIIPIDEHSADDMTLQVPLKSQETDLGTSSSTDRNKTHINDLPEAILLIIFSFFSIPNLRNASKVNLLWNRISHDYFLWFIVDLSPFRKSLTTERVCDLVKINMAPGPKRLSLAGCFIDKNVFVTLSEHSPLLSVLDLTSCDLLKQDLPMSTLSCMAHMPPKLRELSLRKCRLVNDEALVILSERASNLERLELGSFDQKVSTITDIGVVHIAKNMKKLSYLAMWRCISVTDSSCREIAHNMPKLLKLYLGECDITNAGVAHIAKDMPQLVLLSLWRCSRVTQEGVWQVIDYRSRVCDTLKFYHVEGLSQSHPAWCDCCETTCECPLPPPVTGSSEKRNSVDRWSYSSLLQLNGAFSPTMTPHLSHSRIWPQLSETPVHPNTLLRDPAWTFSLHDVPPKEVHRHIQRLVDRGWVAKRTNTYWNEITPSNLTTFRLWD